MSAEHSPIRKARRDSGVRLREALLALTGGRGRILSHTERGWASITFAGTRHSVVMAFEDAAAIAAGESLVADLPDHEFAIPGQLVADAAVTQAVHSLLPGPRLQVTAELLLLADC
jgi:hypothetical protein